MYYISLIAKPGNGSFQMLIIHGIDLFVCCTAFNSAAELAPCFARNHDQIS